MPTDWSLMTVNQTYCVVLGAENGSAQNNVLTQLTPLINYLNSIAQPGTTISLADLHYMKIINDNCIGFVPNNNTPANLPQTFDWGSIIASYPNDLADDIAANI